MLAPPRVGDDACCSVLNGSYSVSCYVQAGAGVGKYRDFYENIPFFDIFNFFDIYISCICTYIAKII